MVRIVVRPHHVDHSSRQDKTTKLTTCICPKRPARFFDLFPARTAATLFSRRTAKHQAQASRVRSVSWTRGSPNETAERQWSNGIARLPPDGRLETGGPWRRLDCRRKLLAHKPTRLAGVASVYQR